MYQDFSNILNLQDVRVLSTGRLVGGEERSAVSSTEHFQVMVVTEDRDQTEARLAARACATGVGPWAWPGFCGARGQKSMDNAARSLSSVLASPALKGATL